jgi:tetratricopeptide (TPR) repeat protein
LGRLFEMLSDIRLHEYNHRVALYGMGGVGKTQTALAYVYARKKFYHSIFWITGVDQAALLSAFRQIALETECAGDISNTTLVDIAREVLAWLQQQRNWLLVIDNLDDVSVIKGFLPSRDQGHTLITTRNPNTSGVPAQGLEVKVLSQHAAVQLLFIHSKIDPISASTADKSEAEKIVEELGYLPLAIEQSGSYIRETSRNIDEFLPLYQRNSGELHRWLPDGNRNYRYTVATTWQMSFTLIRTNQECPAAASLLQLFAFLNPDLVLLDFLVAGSAAWGSSFSLLESIKTELLKKVIVDPLELDKTLKILERFSLVKRIRETRAVSIHRLVQEVIQNDMDETERSKWWETIVSICFQAFPHEVTEETRPLCRKYQEQVLIPLSKSPELKSRTLALALSFVACFLWDDGKFIQAEMLFKKAWGIMTGLNGPQHPDTLGTMSNLAATFVREGRWDDAVAIQETVLKSKRQVHGDRHSETLVAMANLASMYWAQGKRNEAAAMRETVLIATEEVDCIQNVPLVVLNSVSLAYYMQGRVDKAVQMQEMALKTRIALHEGWHPDRLRVMATLATMYWEQGRWDKAAPMQEFVLDRFKAVYGERHHETLKAMANLSFTYRVQGRLNEAAKMMEVVVESNKVLLGERHPDTLTSMSGLARTYWQQGRREGLAAMQENILEAMREVFGEQHFETLNAKIDLAYMKENSP